LLCLNCAADPRLTIIKQVASRAQRLGLDPAGVSLLAATRVEAILDAMAALQRSELDALHIEGFRVERPR
jgi:hypothetical protein